YYGSNTTNAKDLATMMYKIYSYDCLGEEYDKKMIALFKKSKTNSKIPKRLPKTLEIAHKTGSLPLYEHDAGIVYSDSRDFIFAAMSNELKSNRDGQLVISTIAKITYEHMIEKQKKLEIEMLNSFNFNQILYWSSQRIYYK
ncbi:MAG: serine hydrolase, partial [Acidaminobacteraceae bacterium]